MPSDPTRGVIWRVAQDWGGQMRQGNTGEARRLSQESSLPSLAGTVHTWGSRCGKDGRVIDTLSTSLEGKQQSYQSGGKQDDLASR